MSDSTFEDLLSDTETKYQLDVPTTCRYFLSATERELQRATSKHDVPDSQTTGADNEENTSPLDENEANGAVGHDGDCMMAVDASVEAD